MPNVRFGIFPYDAARTVWPQNSFTITDDIATVEMFLGEVTFRAAEAVQYGQILDALWAKAVEGEAARPFIAAALRA